MIDQFNFLTNSSIKKQLNLGLENKTLRNLRDTLLPKLISGELRIPNAEKLVEEAGV